MRTVIILGLSMIAFAIRDNVISTDYGYKFLGIVIMVSMVMDIIEFIKKNLTNKI